MKSKKEIESYLEKVEDITKKIQTLKNPPEDYKIENSLYRSLIDQQNLLKYLLGDPGFEFDNYYATISDYLASLENE